MRQRQAEEFLRTRESTLQALPALLLPWYDTHKRDLPWRRTRDPYRIYVSEIMLQQTRVGAVIGYYERFLEQFPTVRSLAAADDDALNKAWEGLGYYSRARNLKRAAITVCEDYGGVFPADHARLRTLSGAGAYTAGAVASIACNERIAAVDGNVLRILARVLAYDRPADETYKSALADFLTRAYPVDRCGDYTQSFMDLGSAVCLPAKPLCDNCPLRGLCLAYARGTQNDLPVRAQKAARKRELRTVFVLRVQERIAVQKRPATGVLARLWELPNALGHFTEQEAIKAIEALGGEITGAFTVRHARHVFTHLEWDMLIYDAAVNYYGTQFTLADPLDKHGVALPTAFRKCLAVYSSS